MTRRRLLALALAAAAIAGLGLAALIAMPAPEPAGGAPIAGAAPSYGPAHVTRVANAAAVVRRLWMPGLDAGYDPQGLAVADGAVLVAAYRSRAFSADRGPCRVFRLDPHSGAITGRLDVPAPCGHAGGLAVAGGTLYIADTHTLFAAPLVAAFAPAAPQLRQMPLAPGLVGALAVSASDAIWLGTYSEKQPGRLSRFGAEELAALPDGATLNAAAASARLPIPTYAQGAAIDRRGRLWLSRSTADWGELDLIDIADGRVARRYPAPPSIEGIAFDPDGRLWEVSEAGVRHVYDNFFAPFVLPFYPLVIAVDPARLH